MYSTVEVDQFPGLDLASPAHQAGCVDLSNVSFEGDGIRTRRGYGLMAATGTARVVSLMSFNHPNSGAEIITAQDATRLQVITDAGLSVAIQADATVGHNTTFAQFGTPSASYIYIGCSTTQTVRRFDANAGTFAAPAGMPAAQLVAVQPSDNRLVAARTGTAGGPGGASSSDSHVWFSSPGAAETWGANDYVQLSPGDGEPIMGLAAWQGMVFAFKKSKFFVFYGNTTGSDGVTEFNYRTVDAEVGALGPKSVCTGPDGVFFVSGKGVYVTTGSDPQLVSGPVQPIFQNTVPAYSSVGALTPAVQPACMWFDGKLFVAYSTDGSANNRMLVLAGDRWSYWTLPATSLSTPRVPDTGFSYPYFHFGVAIGDPKVGYAYTGGDVHATDEGTGGSVAISAHYESGFSTWGTAHEKRPVETRLFGSGQVSLGWARDYAAQATAGSVTLGTSPAVGQGVVRSNAKRGRLFSWRVDTVSGVWWLARLQHELEVVSPPATRTP